MHDAATALQFQNGQKHEHALDNDGHSQLEPHVAPIEREQEHVRCNDVQNELESIVAPAEQEQEHVQNIVVVDFSIG